MYVRYNGRNQLGLEYQQQDAVWANPIATVSFSVAV
jgi:hypothetical protein